MTTHVITRTTGMDRAAGVQLECVCGWSTRVLDGASADEAVRSHLDRHATRRAAAEDQLTGQVDGRQRINL